LINYRKATLDDVRPIRNLLLNWLKESPLNLGKPNTGKGDAYIHDIIYNHFVIVAEKEGKIIGTISLVLGDMWYTDKKFYRVNWLYVDNKKRNSRIAKKLLEYVKEYVKITKMPLILEMTQGHDIDRKHQWLMRQNFEYLGGTYGDNL
jgi:N-acetylglutamate synthase-like GNAT family acetyltransferase